MPIEYEVTVLAVDARGRLYWRSTLSVNDALLTLLRFARQHPDSSCRIELRMGEAEMESLPFEIKPLAHDADGGTPPAPSAPTGSDTAKPGDGG